MACRPYIDAAKKHTYLLFSNRNLQFDGAVEQRMIAVRRWQRFQSKICWDELVLLRETQQRCLWGKLRLGEIRPLLQSGLRQLLAPVKCTKNRFLLRRPRLGGIEQIIRSWHDDFFRRWLDRFVICGSTVACGSHIETRVLREEVVVENILQQSRTS
jgi:hypothetical protein